MEGSEAEIKKLGTALGQVGPKNGAKTGSKMGAKNEPRCLQVPKRLQEVAREPSKRLQEASRESFWSSLASIWDAFGLHFGPS